MAKKSFSFRLEESTHRELKLIRDTGDANGKPFSSFDSMLQSMIATFNKTMQDKPRFHTVAREIFIDENKG